MLAAMKTASIISLSVIACMSFASIGLAEDAEPTPTPLPKSGSLATSFTGGASGSTSTSWGQDVLEKSAAPLGGSVSRSGTSWVAKVFNNSKDSFSADVKLVQINARGGSARNDYFSVSLRPGQSSERTYSVANGAVSANLELSGWKKLGGQEKKPESDAEAGSSSAGTVVKK